MRTPGNVVANQLMGPASIGGDEDRRTRSALVASQLLGLDLMPLIWEIEPLASMPDGDVIAAVGSNIQRYIDGAPNLGGTDIADGEPR